MKRPSRHGDPCVPAEPVSGFGGGARDLTCSETRALAEAIVQVAQCVRAGQAAELEVRVVEKAGRALQIDLAAAAGWSPSLVLRALLTQPAAARTVAAIWSDSGFGRATE